MFIFSRRPSTASDQDYEVFHGNLDTYLMIVKYQILILVATWSISSNFQAVCENEKESWTKLPVENLASVTDFILRALNAPPE